MATTYQPNQRQEPRPESGFDAISRWLTGSLTINWYTIAYILIVIVALVTRFAGLGDRVMSHDESLHTYYSWRLMEAGDFQHTPLMHGPILFHVTAFFYFIFGANDFTARIYPALIGALMVLVPLLFRRWIGRYGALLASIMFLVSPLLLYYNRYIREDTPAILATLLMAYAFFMYLDGPDGLRRKARWLYLLAGAMLWNLATKETAFINIAIFGAFFTVYFLVRVVQYVTKRPARLAVNLILTAITLGAATSLLMIAVFSVALYNFPSLQERLTYLGEQFNLLVSGGVTGFDFNVFVTWTLLVIVGIVLLLVSTALYATARGGGRIKPVILLMVLLLAVASCCALLAVEEVTQQPTRQIVVSDPSAEGGEAVAVKAFNMAPILAAYALAFIVVVGAVISRRSQWWRKALHRFPELDILIVMGSLILPWLSPLLTAVAGGNPVDYSTEGITRSVMSLVAFAIISIAIGVAWNPKRWLIAVLVFHIPFAFFYTTMFTNTQGLATGMVGSLGYWLEQQGEKRGSQPQYYYTFIVMPLYEYLPIIGAALATLAGMVKLWKSFIQRRLSSLSQDELAFAADDTPIRGVESMDDEAPPAAALVGDGLPSARVARPITHPNWVKRPSFMLFASWWGAFIFLFLTYAGEKMPWLGTHLTVPLIFMAAGYFGVVFAHTDWQAFARRGWLYLLLLPLLFVAIVQILSPFVVGQSPFGGLNGGVDGLAVENLQRLGAWFGVVAIAVLALFLIWQVTRRVGWRHLRHMIGVAAFCGLAVLTFRHAWLASFINYDLATETLVYAHGAPGIKQMMAQIDDISRRTTDGMNLKFAWGGNAWPVTWYFRDMPNATFFASNPTPGVIGDAVAVYASDDIRSRVEPLLEERYYHFEYVRMWWPDQEYFYMNGTRVLNTLDFSPENTNAAVVREGIFNIWWNRDYAKYGEATGRDYSLANWPVSESMHFYVRKDVAAQVWNLGVGEGTVFSPLDNIQANVCTQNWQAVSALSAFAPPQAMNHPLDIAVDDAANRVYVAEEFGQRIGVYDKDGVFIEYIEGGTEFVQPFNRPNGVDVAADGSVYIADTWNYRIRAFSGQGEQIAGFGQPGQFGPAAPVEPLDGFWGPRDVQLDSADNVYVSDTGNKRVRVYDRNGTWLRDIGSAGSAPGQLDEPSGIAITSDGKLYVADTWNRRVSVFSTNGEILYTFPVRGWYEDLGNRPYLAIDESRNLVYVGDSDAGRVLVYDTLGNCIGSFGEPSDVPTALTQFDTVGALTTDAEGNVYISDSSAGRVLKFAPFVNDPVVLQGDGQAVGADPVVAGMDENPVDVIILTAELADDTSIEVPPVETTAEVTAETTVEAGS